MKDFDNESKRRQKKPTTNYAKDTHRAFCDRCFSFNCGCPATKSKRKDSKCSL